MAAPAKTTSSSLSIPCRTNPCLKKSETNDPMRRSFSGNPFSKPSIVTNPRAFNAYTPANSPSDYPRRHSTGRESVPSSRDFDKENTKDQNMKPTRIKSPAHSKGAKNFMSPTISAASKIIPSPRKKILVERNEPTRSSVSFSDVRGLIMEDNESTPQTNWKQKKVSFSDVESIVMANNESTPKSSLKQKKVSFADVKSVAKEDNVDTTNGSSSSTHEHDESSKSYADIVDYKESKNGYDSLLQTFMEEKDSCNLDPNFEISPRVPISPSCPVIAPLDADPSMPPYDPKNNYLSPRPQFLHYRPNPRIEFYRKRDGKQLEEHFGCESCSDSDVTEETRPEEGSQRDTEDISSEQDVEEETQQEYDVTEETQPEEGSQRDPEDISSEQDVEEETQQEYLAEVETVEPKRMSKSRFFTRSKFIAFLLVLAFGYFAIIVANSPAFTHSGFEDLSLPSFQLPPEVTEFAKVNFDRFTRILQDWWSSVLSCVSNIISSSREFQISEPLRYANLSQLLDDHKSEGHVMSDDHIILKPKNFYQEVEAADDADDEDEFEEQYQKEIEVLEAVFDEELNGVQQEIVSEMIEQEHLEAEESIAQVDAESQSSVQFDDQPSITAQDSEVQLVGVQQVTMPELIEADENIAQIDDELQSSVEFGNHPSMITHATEVQYYESKSGNTGDDDSNNVAETVSTENKDATKFKEFSNYSPSSEIVDSSINGTEEQLLTKNVMGLSLLVLCLLAATAFIYRKIGIRSVTKAAVPVEQQPLLAKKKSASVKATTLETSRNLHRGVDYTESCPSEVSSYQRSSSSSSYSESSYSKNGVNDSNEHHSQEKRTRYYDRESLASSDYSYGSFTTYEKRRNKYGGEEEVVTPVRRSSRIRSQVTSP